MPWQELIRLVEPFYPKADGPGRPPKPLLWMLKLYFLQIWYGLSGPQTEELMHDSHAVQEFLGLDLGKDAPPDETTILRFRHLIERHQSGPRILKLVNRRLRRSACAPSTPAVIKPGNPANLRKPSGRLFLARPLRILRKRFLTLQKAIVQRFLCKFLRSSLARCRK